MKKWDMDKSGLLSTTSFVAYEDTTELNDNPVVGAEHWRQSTRLPKVGVQYEYFLHRTEAADVISHRIDFNVSGVDVPAGSILYGDFQVQHDLDTFRDTFTPPAACMKSNLMKCPSDHVERVEQLHFKHDFAVRQMDEASVVV